MAWAAAVSKGFGGSKALVASLVLGCACLLPAIASSALHAGRQWGPAGSLVQQKYTTQSICRAHVIIYER